MINGLLDTATWMGRTAYKQVKYIGAPQTAFWSSPPAQTHSSHILSTQGNDKLYSSSSSAWTFWSPLWLACPVHPTSDPVGISWQLSSNYIRNPVTSHLLPWNHSSSTIIISRLNTSQVSVYFCSCCHQSILNSMSKMTLCTYIRPCHSSVQNPSVIPSSSRVKVKVLPWPTGLHICPVYIPTPPTSSH